MDRTVQNTFNAFYPTWKKGEKVDKDIMLALVLAQGEPELDEAMHDIMTLFKPYLVAEAIDRDEWSEIITGSEKLVCKYGRRLEVARIVIAIISYLDKQHSGTLEAL